MKHGQDSCMWPIQNNGGHLLLVLVDGRLRFVFGEKWKSSVLYCGTATRTWTGVVRSVIRGHYYHLLSSLARTLGLYVRISLKAWMSLCVYSVFVLSFVGSDLAKG
jgi:hypothetical protein